MPDSGRIYGNSLSSPEMRANACAGLLQETEKAVSPLVPEDILPDFFSDLDPLDPDPVTSTPAGKP